MHPSGWEKLGACKDQPGNVSNRNTGTDVARHRSGRIEWFSIKMKQRYLQIIS
jgi:hypothetical protein